MKTLGEVFNPYLADKPLADDISSAELLKLNINSNNRSITMTAKFGGLVLRDNLFAAEKQISKSELNLGSVRINPIYDSKLFSADYFPELYKAVKRDIPSINGTLNNAFVTYEEGNLQITLNNGGKSLLDAKGFDKALKRLVAEEFSLEINIIYTGTLEVDGQSEEYMQTMKNAAEKIERQKIEESVHDTASNEAVTKAVKEKRNSDAVQEIEVREGKFLLPQIVEASIKPFYGRSIRGKIEPISTIVADTGRIVVWGDIFDIEKKVTKSGDKNIFVIDITDYSGSTSVKVFGTIKDTAILDNLKKGDTVVVQGDVEYDRYAGELMLIARSIGTANKVKVVDKAEEKRVELHLHTNMSQMDAVTSAGDLVKRAADWGHPAVAITDHGVAQAFPDAMKAADKINKDGEKIKVIYGTEAYFMDDLVESVSGKSEEPLDGTFICFDIETTGLSANRDKITEIGAVKVENGQITDTFSTFANPGMPIPAKITELTGITDAMVKDAPSQSEAVSAFLEFAGDNVLVAHNAPFDTSFIRKACENMNREYNYTSIDTVAISRAILTDIKNCKLDTVAKYLRLGDFNHHRATDDAEMLARIFINICTRLKDDYNITKTNEINTQIAGGGDFKKLPTYHQIILVKNLTGLKNLYKLISYAHLTYFYKKPRIPKSELVKHREGLIIGSACCAGQLYQAILLGKPWPEIKAIASFYDYLEIQPAGNNNFMIREGRFANEAELHEIDKTIVKLGKELGKPVCATCDVHFMDPKDADYRKILMAGQGFKDAEDQAPLYLRTTAEMLKEFEYLGKEKAYEVVVTNPRKIADMCESIRPIPKGTFPPNIEGAEEELVSITWERAKEKYGDPLPEIVKARLDKELNSITTYGFSVLYMTAQKLVADSEAHGYLVGSRGSVGSSFVATMSGISEVNPLCPHYICPKCKHSEFITDGSYGSGFDMPPKNCPECGTLMDQDGHEIPFETFLGFKGDKVPDIDLNFSSEYQSNAHDYTEVIFGAGHTFRAGTVGTLAEKTAYGYVKKYYEEREQSKRGAEIERISQGCVGVRRSTGQHPGGIVVLPMGEEIYTFTPVQHPANDMTSKIITTHFDYHKIDANLLKLDILGHQDPTMIRMLEDLTGVDASQIRMDDKEVLSLFESTEALGIKPEDIDGCPFGCLGLPEFGTPFVHGMLKEAKPKNFSDLVRISGLSHGTDVWLGNAQYYISTGDCTLSTAICTRDDIMIYLIHMGVENERSFKIMESVRKGKGLTPDMEEDMRACNVPDWYIESCKKIKYMFPKAHAAAYVMMALRVAYFKVHYPLSYYAAFFSIRATSFNYELMCLGKERLGYYMDDYKKRKNELSDKEKDTFEDMKIVQEMYARGFEFVKIDIYRAKANRFQIVDGKLMPAFSTIDGLGDKAAEMIEDEASKGKFLSREDFKNRCKVSEKVVETMADLGLMGDLPHSNQISLMDFMEM